MPRRAIRLSLVAGAVIVLGLAGCGVSRSGPTDEGDAAVVGAAPTDSEFRNAPVPDSAASPDGLVRDFLRAAVGGGKAGTEQVKKFLNAHALATWPVPPENPPMTVIRLLHAPTTGAATGGRTPVIVDYQVVGPLSDRGQVDDLADPANKSMTFWVVPDEHNPSNLRVDEVVGGQPGLMLSDEALAEGPAALYRIQPIYFWDASSKVLVPDVRYVPLTDPADVRASRLVQFLADGPSSWLTSAVLRLPQGTTPEPVVSDNGTLVVKLSAEAAPAEAEGLRRLLFQLQWTLKPTTGSPTVRLVIDDKVQDVPVGPHDYLGANLSWNFHVSPLRYDISQEQKVVLSLGGPPAPAALAAAENLNVVSAAVGSNGAAAAFVRAEPNGRRYLQIVHEAGVVDTGLARGFNIGRPVFVPESNDSVLVVSNGRLFAVSGVDGAATEIARAGSGVSSVSVSPDGRRVAFVANGQVYVTPLTVLNNAITVGSNLRPILSGQINAATVAWTGESWLAVAGVAPTGGPALWRVTADGVVAQNLSENLKGVTVTDLVAYPLYPDRTILDVLAMTPQGVYSYFSSLAQEPGLRAPFYGG